MKPLRKEHLVRARDTASRARVRVRARARLRVTRVDHPEGHLVRVRVRARVMRIAHL